MNTYFCEQFPRERSGGVGTDSCSLVIAIGPGRTAWSCIRKSWVGGLEKIFSPEDGEVLA